MTACTLMTCTCVFAAPQPQTDLVRTRCNNNDDASIERMISSTVQVDRLLPNIPPEEEHYLKAESASIERARGPRAKQMSAALHARPLYSVYELRGYLTKAQAALKHILDPVGHRSYPENSEAERLDRAVGALRPLARYSDSLADYYGRQVGDDDKNSEYQKLAVQSLMALYDTEVGLGDYIRCKLVKSTITK